MTMKLLNLLLLLLISTPLLAVSKGDQLGRTVGMVIIVALYVGYKFLTKSK